METLKFDQFIQQIKKQGYGKLSLLSSEQVSGILQVFHDQLHQGNFQLAKVGSGSEKSHRPEIRGDMTCWVELNKYPVLKPYEDFLEALKTSLNQECFLRIKETEIHFAHYPIGSFYKKHSDRHQKNSSRVFSCILYLNLDWKEGDGGEVVIYNKEGEMVEKVLPEAGTFVGFLSEDFPHEVLPAKKERKSLTGWMHDKIIS